jgi:hypothetical protein
MTQITSLAASTNTKHHNLHFEIMIDHENDKWELSNVKFINTEEAAKIYCDTPVIGKLVVLYSCGQ